MLRTRVRLLCVALIALSSIWAEAVQAQSKSPLKLAHVAGEEPLVAVLWNGLGDPQPDSTNHTQKLLAEESLRDYFKQLTVQFENLIPQGIRPDASELERAIIPAVPLFYKSLFTHPSAIVLNKIGATPNEYQFAVVVDAGKDIDTLRTTLDRLIELQSQDDPDSVTVQNIGGGKFYGIANKTDDYSTHVGTLGSHFVLAVGEDTLQPLVARLQQSKTPKWVEKQLADLPVDQPNLLVSANVRKLLSTVDEPEFDTIAKALGIDGVNHFSLVGGFDAAGVQLNTLISLQGAPRGLLAMVPNKPLKLDAFRRVPANATSAAVVRFDLEHALNLVLEMADAANPTAKEDIEAGIEQTEQQLGFSVRKDLCQGLGDEWTLYTANGAGGALFVPTFVLSATVRDQSKVQKVLTAGVKFLDIIGPVFGPEPPFTVHEYTVKGNKAVRLQLNIPLGITPCWVLTKDEFVFSLLPQLLSSHLSQAGKPSLADSEALKAGFKRTPNPVLMSYSDPKPRLRGIYSLVNTFAPMAAVDIEKTGVKFEPPPLPPLTDLEPHLQPTVTAISFDKTGLRLEARGVVPGGIEMAAASAGLAPGMLIPAVKQARDAARMSDNKNNLKQIAIALMNYQETYGRFPGPAILDKRQRPRLSWRVEILPYIDEQVLYEQFHRDEPWDSDHNKTLIAKMPKVFASPNYPELGKQGKTTYLVPLGKGTMWDNPKGNKDRDVLDGLSNTILIVDAHQDAAVIWTKPDDLTIDFKDLQKTLKNLRPGRFHAVFAEGTVRLLSEDIDLEVLKGLFTRAGNEDVGDF